MIVVLDTYCAGHYYNITSNMVYIAPNSAACFRCILPGQNIPDMWLVNGKEDAYNINAEGTLIVTNTSEVFGDPKTNPKLECGNKVYNSSLTASIAYTGIRGMSEPAHTCTCMQQVMCTRVYKHD